MYDENGRPSKLNVLSSIVDQSRRKRQCILFVTLSVITDEKSVLFANDGRNGRRWIFKTRNLSEKKIMSLLKTLAINEFRDTLLIPVGFTLLVIVVICLVWKSNEITLENHKSMRLGLEIYSHNCKDITSYIGS